MPEIRPADMPEVRGAMIEWNRQMGADYFTACIGAGVQRVYVPATAPSAGAWYARTETTRLAAADLFWVSRDMTELCITAARSMPEWALSPEDMPSPSGLIFFEGLPAMRDFPTTAMGWGPCPSEVVAAAGLKGRGIWLTHYVDPIFTAEAEGLTFRQTRQALPPLLYHSESLAAFGRREEGDIGFYSQDNADFTEIAEDGLIRRAASLVILKAAWLLMQQGIATQTDAGPDRAARKRLHRAGHEPAPVRVIELRRPKATGGHGDGDREYHHQWIVRGHWRQQWYPAREVHRPVWIAPHIKGPEGAPLIGGEKVYALKR